MSLNLPTLFTIFAVLVGINGALFLGVCALRVARLIQAARRARHVAALTPVLDELFSNPPERFDYLLTTSIVVLASKTESDFATQTLEELLLERIDQADDGVKQMARSVAYSFEFPQKCIAAISGYVPENVAAACRKAGCYQFSDAIPDMTGALRIPSSDVQFQALMAIARIGDAQALTKAYEAIEGRVLLNKHAIFQIVKGFSGSVMGQGGIWDVNNAPT